MENLTFSNCWKNNPQPTFEQFGIISKSKYYLEKNIYYDQQTIGRLILKENNCCFNLNIIISSKCCNINYFILVKNTFFELIKSRDFNHLNLCTHTKCKITFGYQKDQSIFNADNFILYLNKYINLSILK